MEKSNTLKNAADVFMRESISERYSYNFEWLGRPIIQYPQDICALQELIWTVKPDLIIETGIAHGGSLIFSASMLALLEMSEAVLNGEMLDPSKPKRKVLGVDIDIRAHNRKAIEAHPMYPRIEMLEGSSISDEIFSKVKKVAANYSKILVVLDSNHTHEHVLSELKLYAPLVSVESYCVVFDTVVEDLSNDAFPDRPWGVGDNPKTAVWEYLKTHPEFEIDQAISDKILISVAPDGYLKRTAS
ncbi:cephalosporin hydroxylase family protein [Thalassospira indica]|uniref:Cephalosporin hydroxylase n=1 Tax=Thalassospira indica TaxID=1891279 RepID=A0ABM6XZK7_9PROT|nr:cephalosporin hydroxylase family protein [Thalassospira indica]AXO14661.1 cephalosporin hydroxylase [Thalassospira indica]